MAISSSRRGFAIRTAVLATGSLGMLFGACKSDGVGRVDGAVDAPQSSATTSTGTGGFTSTNTMPNTGRGTSTGTASDSAGRTDLVTRTSTATATVSASAQATVSASAQATVSASAQATVVSTGPRTGPFTGTATAIGTSKPTQTVWSSSSGTEVVTGINTNANTFTRTTTTICYPAGRTDGSTGTATGGTTAPSTGTGTSTGVCATWNQIKSSRTNGLGYCPVAGTAKSVIVKRGDDGSLILSGDAFRAVPGDVTQCYVKDRERDVCLEEQAFLEITLTPPQGAELERLVAAMPPGWCTPKGTCDPCIRTTLTIDQFSNTDWVGCCYESSGPGTHMAGEHAIVSFIDSLIPAKTPAGIDASAADTIATVDRASGPCDIYADAQTPCAAAYSVIRVLSKSYGGPLFQIRGGSSSLNNTMSGGTTKDIMPGPDGFVDAATVDEACGSTYCTVSVLYDHSGNRNDLKRAPKGNTAAGETAGRDDYESIATKGQVTAGGHRAYSLFMNKLEGYRTQSGVVGKGMPTGTQPQGIYMLADGTRNATGCCWEFGNVTSKPATELASADALYFGVSSGARGAGTGPWFLADLGSSRWAGGEVGEPGLNPVPNPGNPSLKVPFALGFLRVSSTKYAIRVADLATASDLITVYDGQLPITVSQKGGIVLGVNGENANTSLGTFYEGAIVSGSPTNQTELSVMANIKAVRYSK